MDEQTSRHPYNLWIPLDMEKAVDTDGERPICGIISTEDTDLDGEQIMEQLADYNPMLGQMGKNLNAALADQVDWGRFSDRAGWLKWEHQPHECPTCAEPGNIIGWPDKIEKGVVYRDPCNGMQKSGTALWGHLFPASAGMEKANKAWDLIQAIRKSDVKRRLGYSIEGAYVPLKNLAPNTKSCLVVNTVITTKPVNSWAWADMAKALTAGPPVTDSAQLTGGAALREQSLGLPEKSSKKKKCEHGEVTKSVLDALEHLVLCNDIPLAKAKQIVRRAYRKAA